MDVLDEEGCRLVEVGLAFEDGVCVEGDGGEAVLGDGVGGCGGHVGIGTPGTGSLFT